MLTSRERRRERYEKAADELVDGLGFDPPSGCHYDERWTHIMKELTMMRLLLEDIVDGD